MLSPTGKRIGETVLRLVKRDNLPLEQAAGDVVVFMEDVERLADATGAPVKQVLEESVALYRKEHGVP